MPIIVPIAAGSQQFEFVETYPPLFSSAAAISSGLIYLGRVRVSKPIPVTQVHIYVGTQSGNVDVGIWSYVVATDIATLITSTGSTLVGTGAAMQSINLLAAHTFLPGLDYVLGYQADNSTVTLQRASNTGNVGLNKRGSTISKTYGLAVNAASLTGLSSGTTIPWIAAS